MVQENIRRDAPLHIVILLLCGIPVLLSFFLHTDGAHTVFLFNGFSTGAGIPCVLHTLTGYRCPACGMTRSFVYMSAFDFSAAWSMNRAGVLLYLYCLLQLPYRLLRLFKPAAAIYGALAAAQAVWLVAAGLFAFYDFLIQFI